MKNRLTPAVIAIFIFLVTAVTTVYASTEAVPGDVLYPLNLFTEEARYKMLRDQEMKTEFRVMQAEIRKDEFERIMGIGTISLGRGNARLSREEMERFYMLASEEIERAGDGSMRELWGVRLDRIQDRIDGRQPIPQLDNIRQSPTPAKPIPHSLREYLQ